MKLDVRLEQVILVPVLMLASDVRFIVVSSRPELCFFAFCVLHTCATDVTGRIADGWLEGMYALLVSFQIVQCCKAIFSCAAMHSTVMAFEVSLGMLPIRLSVTSLRLISRWSQTSRQIDSSADARIQHASMVPWATFLSGSCSPVSHLLRKRLFEVLAAMLCRWQYESCMVTKGRSYCRSHCCQTQASQRQAERHSPSLH